jgi:putative nucleotidyltransferase with HDIG domain
MFKDKAVGKAGSYQTLVTVTGIAIWLGAATALFEAHSWRDLAIDLALMLLVFVVSMFLHVFPIPWGAKLTQEKLTFSLSDAIILLVACWYGPFLAVVIGGIEGFATSRRAVRRLSSNLFSSGMMAITVAAAAACMRAVLHNGSNGGNRGQQSLLTVAFALLVASMVHIVTNTGLLSSLLALRHGNRIFSTWKQTFLWAAPMFLPTGAAASLMYVALQYNALIMVVIGAPILIALYLGHRQSSNSIQDRIQLLEKSHRETIEALAVAINAKDEVTHEHVLRVQIYAAGVARILGCSDLEIEALRAGSLLHDIGKLAVPDYILNKPGKLTADEFEKMKTHTLVGAQILGRVDFPYPVVPIVRHHHERWDGNGYPDGLKGEAIPLTARILSVVDCFDAVREDRQYRRGMTREQAIDFIMRGSGEMYDPRVVGTFITHLPQFEAEVLAHRNDPLPTFGIEPLEQLSETARLVAPAAGLAEPAEEKEVRREFSHRELKSLYELARTIHSAPTRDAAVDGFMDKLKALVPYDCCAITLAASDQCEYTVTHAAGAKASLLIGRKTAIGEGVTGWVIANQTPFCNTDPKLDLSPSLAAKFEGFRTLAVYPITKDSRMIGTLALYSAELSEYGSDAQNLLSEAAMLIGTALSVQPERPYGFHVPRPDLSMETSRTLLASDKVQ